MEIIYTTLVGSKMHSLSTPSSDDDIRHITRMPIRHILSPFKNEEIKVKDSNGDDVESWELRHFVKHLTSGNPTCYEVIKSPLYENLPHADTIRSLMPLCYDAKKIMYAHIGYAEAQLKRYLRKADEDFKDFFRTQSLYKKNFLLGIPKKDTITPQESGNWEENHLRRIPKSVVAAYRVLAQGSQLLNTHDFEPVVANYSQKLHDELMEIKLMDANTITWEFINTHLTKIENQIQLFKSQFDSMSESAKNEKPNIEAIEDVLCEIYGVG